MDKKITLFLFLMIFLLVFLIFPDDVKAQEAGEKSKKVPPKILLTLDNRTNWKLGEPTDNKILWAYQILFDADKFDKASEAITVTWLYSLPENTDFKKYVVYSIDVLKRIYLGHFNWNLIEEKDDIVMIEAEQPGQHEIYKYMTGPYGIYIVFYTNKNATFSQEEKEYWINKLKKAHFKDNILTNMD